MFVCFRNVFNDLCSVLFFIHHEDYCAGRLSIDFAEIPGGVREARLAAAEERLARLGVL